MFPSPKVNSGPSVFDCLLFRDVEFGVQGRGGILAGPDVECAGLNSPQLGLRAPEFELILAQREPERQRHAGLNCDALESLELTDWARR